MLTLIARILHILNSDDSPNRITWGLILGIFIGLTPSFGLIAILTLFIATLFRVNLSTFFISWGIFELLAFIFSPLFHKIGLALLSMPSLESTWSAMYQSDILLLAGYNHTTTLGAFVTSLVFFIPIKLFFAGMIEHYRTSIKAFIEKFHIVQTLKASRLYRVYLGVSGGGNL